MVNQEVRTIMKSLIPINNSQIVEKVMLFQDEFKTIVGQANLGEVDSDLPEDGFGIYDTSNFLASLDLLDDPEIVLENGTIIASDESSKLRFITSDPSQLDIDVNPKVITTTLKVDSAMEFDIGSELLNKIKKASSVFKTFDTLFIIKEGRNVSLKIGSKDSFSKTNNSFSINIIPSLDNGNDNDFELALPLESILKIPVMDYTFRIKHNIEKDVYRIVVDNDLLIFILSLMK